MILNNPVAPRQVFFLTCILLILCHSTFAGDSLTKQSDTSLGRLNKALLLEEERGDKKSLYTIYEKYCQVFSQNGSFAIALDYYFKMLRILDDEMATKHDTVGALKNYASTFARIGTCYFDMDNESKALAYYRKSLAIVNRLAVLDKTYPAADKQMKLYANFGSAYLSSYRFDEAKLNFEKALELNRDLNNPAGDATLYNNLGIVFKERKDFAEAFRFYNRSLRSGRL